MNEVLPYALGARRRKIVVSFGRRIISKKAVETSRRAEKKYD
jgi:hypothetical protein